MNAITVGNESIAKAKEVGKPYQSISILIRAKKL